VLGFLFVTHRLTSEQEAAFARLSRDHGNDRLE
jgi:hypothetical protein